MFVCILCLCIVLFFSLMPSGICWMIAGSSSITWTRAMVSLVWSLVNWTWTWHGHIDVFFFFNLTMSTWDCGWADNVFFLRSSLPKAQLQRRSTRRFPGWDPGFSSPKNRSGRTWTMQPWRTRGWMKCVPRCGVKLTNSLHIFVFAFFGVEILDDSRRTLFGSLLGLHLMFFFPSQWQRIVSYMTQYY